jgi:hypothetical protein
MEMQNRIHQTVEAMERGIIIKENKGISQIPANNPIIT